MPSHSVVRINGVVFSLGNTKLGAIPSVSTLPQITCEHNGPRDCSRTCYARKLARLRKHVAATWLNNADILTGDRPRYFAAIRQFLEEKRPTRFRWHVAGDIPDREYLDEMIRIARAFGDVRFLAFTKSYNLLHKQATDLPANLTIRVSAWPGCRWRSYQSAVLAKGYPVSWMVNPRESDSGYAQSVPCSAKLCPGSCETCDLCWRKRTQDVKLMAH